MTLLTFHYVLTSFFLGVWIGPVSARACIRNISWVLTIHFLLQMILFFSGKEILDDSLFWGWQTLATFEGVMLSNLFLWAYGTKHTFLEVKHRYERVWLTFFVSTAAFIGIQVFYTKIAHPFGILFSILGTIIVLVGTGYSLLFDNVVFESAYKQHAHVHLIRFIGLWILLTVSMQAVFFAQPSNLSERDLAFISGGGALFWIILLALFFHKSPHLLVYEDYEVENEL